MKCYSRSTFGVIIGIFSILTYLILTIFSFCALMSVYARKENYEPGKHFWAHSMVIFAVLIAIFLIMVILSVLLTVGIAKRRHKLILPWLILSSIGFFSNLTYFLYSFISLLIRYHTSLHLLGLLIYFLIFLFFVISANTLLFIFNLYQSIKEENNGISDRLMTSKSVYN
ncbi:uncharacterized protein ACRADG_010250 [Cochliomyia hominivorax]